ncbi:TetR/AcrR family transcriptional regulator [Microbacterium sp. ABRD28]|uniref:TetR/AcrR family transcriptional regulator n=1 Tax=Microbacterium sp. ABRD28 TaxID=2268461 RepID=UPI001F0BC35F|nr:TetR/AcrR family transcriptional regulator [Microbacterium sp. ABRD28]
MSVDEEGGAAASAGLSTGRVVLEAIRLADAEGVHGLSMRRLATVLNAGAMTLYHYVANKEELLDAMVDVVFDEIALPREDVEWRQAIRERALSARGVLARHRWAIGLLDTRTAPGPANLRHHEAVTACLRKAGFSVAMATHANWVLDSYLYGHALQAGGLSLDTPDDFAEAIDDVYLPQLPAEQFPYLSESATTLAAAGYDPSEEFLFGLDLILDGLEARRGGGESGRPLGHTGRGR